MLERLPMPRPGEVLRDLPQRRRRRSPLPISRRRWKILLSGAAEEEGLPPLCPLTQRTSQRILDAISHVIYSNMLRGAQIVRYNIFPVPLRGLRRHEGGPGGQIMTKGRNCVIVKGVNVVM